VQNWGWQALRRTRLLPQSVEVNAPLLSEADLAQLRHAGHSMAYAHESVQRHLGDLRSVHLGGGLDFEEVRPYQPGDDVRGMDWRTTARAARPYVKIYRETHQPALHIVLDRSASMRFGTHGRLKVTQAARLTALLALHAARAHTCIGGSVLQTPPLMLPCHHGERGALQLIRAAITPCPPLDTAGLGAAPCWAELLTRLDAQLPRASRVMLISDFRSLAETDAAALLRLASRHQLQAFQVLDRTETALPDVGLMRFQDAVTGALRWLDTGNAALRAAFAQHASARQAAQLALFRRAGVALRRCRADADALEILTAP
jgi:uncharacterized protein (DUF58 family)